MTVEALGMAGFSSTTDLLCNLAETLILYGFCVFPLSCSFRIWSVLNKALGLVWYLVLGWKLKLSQMYLCLWEISTHSRVYINFTEPYCAWKKNVIHDWPTHRHWRASHCTRLVVCSVGLWNTTLEANSKITVCHNCEINTSDALSLTVVLHSPRTPMPAYPTE